MNDILLLAHAGFGVMGCLGALWVFIEALNARPANASRIKTAAVVTAVCIDGGLDLWRVLVRSLLPSGKGFDPEGSMAVCAQFLYGDEGTPLFVTAILALLLPITTREKLYASGAARKLVLSVAALTVITGLAVEGAGAVIDHGVKIALLQSKGAR